MEPRKDNEHEEGTPFFPHHMLEQGVVILLVIELLVVLAVLVPPHMHPPADPFDTPEHIKPEWYFLGVYQALKLADYLSFLGAWAPKTLGVLGQGVVFFLLLVFPFLDKNPERHPKRRPFMVTVGILGLIAMVILTYWGHVS